MTAGKTHIHFIAIGGSLMHNLALALQKVGFHVTGSDDEIYEPSRSKLEAAGLLPDSIGWDANRITKDVDAVILGMHARENNTELAAAREQDIPVYSFPEYIHRLSENKQRIVITGSHGKSTITSMIMHVLAYHKRKFDYAVGAEVPGFPTTVQFSDAPVIIIEGDEYLSSPIDREPKFLKYKHHIALISGIAWDHINVFPTEEGYIEQFEKLADQTPKAGSLIYFTEDPVVNRIGSKERLDVLAVPYETPDSVIKDGVTYLKEGNNEIKVDVFGQHNLQNMMGAMRILNRMRITDEMFYEAISSFKGAAKRLELLGKENGTHLYRDYAHAPSKVRASISAVKRQHEGKELVACLELHTFSSLTESFLPQYAGAMDHADIPVVYFNPKTLEHKDLPPLDASKIQQAFENPNVKVFSDREELVQFLESLDWSSKNLLMMSSGTFDKLNLDSLQTSIYA